MKFYLPDSIRSDKGMILAHAIYGPVLGKIPVPAKSTEFSGCIDCITCAGEYEHDLDEIFICKVEDLESLLRKAQLFERGVFKFDPKELAKVLVQVLQAVELVKFQGRIPELEKWNEEHREQIEEYNKRQAMLEDSIQDGKDKVYRRYLPNDVNLADSVDREIGF